MEAVTLFVEDLTAGNEFYQSVFELPVFYEDPDSVVFKFGDMLVNLLQIAQADELIAPAQVANQAAGNRFVFTIGVEDVDARCALLSEKGVTFLNGPINRPWGIRTASFKDPNGYIWEIAGAIPKSDSA